MVNRQLERAISVRRIDIDKVYTPLKHKNVEILLFNLLDELLSRKHDSIPQCGSIQVLHVENIGPAGVCVAHGDNVKGVC